MSSEDECPQLEESKSPEIVTASCSLSSSTSSLTSSPRESLPPLLLQIQQFHTAEIQKLQDQVNRWKIKCVKLAKVSNDNAAVAKKYSKQNKLLQAEVMKLKQRLRLLDTRENQVVNSSKIQAAALTLEAPQERSSPSNDLPEKLFRAPNKLTSKKSNRKVRYEEISPTGSFQNPSAETAQLRNLPEETKPNNVLGTKRPTMNEKPLAHLQALQDTRQAIASPGGIILAPDSCVSPSILETHTTRNPGGHGISKPFFDGPRKVGVAMSVLAIPEILEVGVDVGASFETADDSLDTPTYASTPVARQSRTSLLSQKSSRMPDSTRLNISPSESSSKQMPHSSALGVSIPRSESQFPVDLTSAQAKSPTFCGEGLATPGSSSGTPRHHGSTAVDRIIPTPHGGDRSEVTDESYESEASMLLLDPHFLKRGAEPVTSSESLPSVSLTAKTTATSEGRHKYDEGKTFCQVKTPRDSCSTRIRAITEECGQGPGIPLNPPSSRISTSRKRKLGPDESAMFDETVLPEDSPEGLDEDNQTSVPAGMSRSKRGKHPSPEDTGSKVQAKGNKTMKQSKLALKKIFPSVNKSASLMRKYNGSSLVNVDSQSDAFMNRAIELSLADHKKAEVPGTDELGPANVGDGFKVPSLPHKKQKGSSSLDAIIAETASEQKHGAFDQDDSDLLESYELIHTPYDLNDTVDPLMDLTQLERETSQSNLKPNQSVTGENTAMRELERRLEAGSEEDDEKLMLEEMANDSCQDLFGDEADNESEGNLEKSTEGGETSFLRNFDKVPEVVDKPNYKYAEVVRKHEDRLKLKGFGCKECEAFYGNLTLTDSQREQRMKMCSRHRAQYSPPNTPAHYWSVGFPDTQTCLERGYIKESRSPNRRSRSRGKNKYKKRFSGKEVDGTRQDVAGDNYM